MGLLTLFGKHYPIGSHLVTLKGHLIQGYRGTGLTTHMTAPHDW